MHLKDGVFLSTGPSTKSISTVVASDLDFKIYLEIKLSLSLKLNIIVHWITTECI